MQAFYHLILSVSSLKQTFLSPSGLIALRIERPTSIRSHYHGILTGCRVRDTLLLILLVVRDTIGIGKISTESINSRLLSLRWFGTDNNDFYIHFHTDLFHMTLL